MIEYVKSNDEVLAIIVRSLFNNQGVHFFTPDDFSQQLAYMSHPAGKIIEPHVHNMAKREVQYTKEVLFIRSGKLRVDFYTEERKYIESKILRAGDVLLLSSGGHGFEVLEKIEMFEVKQGPYTGDKDKTRFEGIGIKELKIND
jgi:mannose-6-phosphate isomerase-like protein (cupin superfamily)